MTVRAKQTSRIRKVSIAGFRSLRKIEHLELPQLTVLIGGNGAGKSTFIRFFEMMSWMMKSQDLQEFVLRQGGGDDQFFMGARHTPRISATIELETAAGVNEYTFDLTHLMVNDTVLMLNEAYRYSDKRGTPANWSKIGEVGKESLLPLQKNKTAQTICHLLRQCQTFQFHDTSINAAIHKRWDVSDSIRLRTDGGNLAAVLLSLKTNEPARYALILQQISRVLPSFKDFVLEPEYGKVLLRWQSQGNDKIFGAHLTSDGSLRLFCLLTLLNMPLQRLPDVMFFDEPELGLHPHAITLVAQMFQRVAQSKQVFIATQSPYLVDCFELENIIVADSQNGETRLHNLPASEYQEWLDDDYLISDIWLKSTVGGV